MRLASSLLALAAVEGLSAQSVQQVHAITSSNGNFTAASTLIDNGLKALGGEEALRNLRGVTYNVPEYDELQETKHSCLIQILQDIPF